MICDECETVAHCMKNGCVPKTNVQQEPVGYWLIGTNLVEFKYNDSYHDGPEWQPLYTSTAQRTWTGLTDADLAGCDEFEYKSACFWEAKLKAKNSP